MSLLACLFACLLACSLVADVLCLLPPSLPPPILLLSLTANLPFRSLTFFLPSQPRLLLCLPLACLVLRHYHASSSYSSSSSSSIIVCCANLLLFLFSLPPQYSLLAPPRSRSRSRSPPYDSYAIVHLAPSGSPSFSLPLFSNPPTQFCVVTSQLAIYRLALHNPRKPFFDV